MATGDALREQVRMAAATPSIVEALKIALPYVERVAATAPFEMTRQKRQRQACADAELIRAVLAKAEAA